MAINTVSIQGKLIPEHRIIEVKTSIKDYKYVIEVNLTKSNNGFITKSSNSLIERFDDRIAANEFIAKNFNQVNFFNDKDI